MATKTHNALLYHCLRCGRVVHVEMRAEPPRCCGCEMTRSAVETIRDDDDSEPAAGRSSTPVRPGQNR